MNFDIQAQEFDLTVREKLVIGKDDDKQPDYLFGGIRSIVVTNHGHIVASNPSDNSIRIFNKEGAFLKKMGRRGRGPSDFLDITTLLPGQNETIIAVDRFQDRITVFDNDYELIHVMQLPEPSMMTLQFAWEREDTGEFLAGYRLYEQASENGNYFHLFDSGFENKKNMYVDVFKHFFDSTKPIEVQMSIPPLYHSTRFGSGHIALVSPVYTGTIAVLDTKTMDSRVIGDNNLLPYQEYDINRRSYYESSGEVGFVSNSGSMGQFFYKTIGSTIGLVGNSNYLLHFYMLFEGSKRIPYVSIYSVDGNLLTTSILEKSPLSLVIDNALMSAPRYLDEDNNLYLTAYHPFPTIRVFETNLDELKME